MTTKSTELLEQPFKTGSLRGMTNKASDNLLDKISTSRILWHLIKRHKFAIVSTWALLITISYLFPPVWDILASLVRK